MMYNKLVDLTEDEVYEVPGHASKLAFMVYGDTAEIHVSMNNTDFCLHSTVTGGTAGNCVELGSAFPYVKFKNQTANDTCTASLGICTHKHGA